MPKYCYWSVATGPYGALMENCVRTARAAGVFKEFHVLTDRPLEGCECYDAMECDKTAGLFKLHYLKVGMSRLSFDYFIWVDADTLFTRNPVDVLLAVRKSPIHVPLELNLSAMTEDREWNGTSCFKLRELLGEKGVTNPPYLSRSAFWILQREAIDVVHELAIKFWNEAKQEGTLVSVDAGLGYAMQILCATPEPHRLEAHPEIWASDDLGHFNGQQSDGRAWSWHHPLRESSIAVCPSLVHLASQRNQSRSVTAQALAGSASILSTAQDGIFQ